MVLKAKEQKKGPQAGPWGAWLMWLNISGWPAADSPGPSALRLKSVDFSRIQCKDLWFGGSSLLLRWGTGVGAIFPGLVGDIAQIPRWLGTCPTLGSQTSRGMVGSTLVLPGEGRGGSGLQTAGDWTKSWVWASHSTLVLKCGWELKGHPTNNCRFCWGEKHRDYFHPSGKCD